MTGIAYARSRWHDLGNASVAERGPGRGRVGRRLVVTPVDTLPSSYRFRLEREPDTLWGGQEVYLTTGPHDVIGAAEDFAGNGGGGVVGYGPLGGAGWGVPMFAPPARD